MQRYFYTLLFCFSLFSALAQITTDPVMPISNQELTITFNSAKESRLGLFSGDLYAHTGVSVEGKGDWQKVIGGWGQNADQPKLKNLGNGIYELKISPTINSFYNVGSSDVITRICLVFRSADGAKQTSDLFINVFQPGVRVSIQSPADGAILEPNNKYAFSATATETASLTLELDGVALGKSVGTAISMEYTFTKSGEATLVATAEVDGVKATDTSRIFVRSEIVRQPLPAGSRKGITYIDKHTARLVLWAPKKSFVYVLGDFNNWKVKNECQMKKDGDYFWLDIPNLTPNQEYLFQYFVDGALKIADPYTAKTCDPWNDSFISSTTYPGLKAYPAGKTEGITSVIQTNQEPFNWSNTDFEIAAKEEMVIYELLVRDFTAAHSFKAIIDKLDYLQDLRVNVLELMPVNEFEGNSSWGYNPSFYFAVDKYYGPANDMKQLVDECHKRGIAVVIDMVLNHSYGQSPFLQLYMNNYVATDDNPWYNKESNFKNTSLTWGNDFNHESPATRELIDSINSYWLNEFNVDGFRFDFTKGFSNTPYPAASWGSEYDAARIANLKRMADEIWKRKHGALVICEHLADNSEEKVLAEYGLMLWGNLNNYYAEAAMGYNESGKSDISWGYYDRRGWGAPNLVTYQESHDEERVAYKCKTWGNANGDYNTKTTATSMQRLAMNALFHLPLPGPKMIWQFGELGYDISIDQNGRVGEKPIKWDYADDASRKKLFKTVASLNYLKQTYPEFTGKLVNYSLSGAVKSYSNSDGNNYMLAVGNFDVVSKTTKVKFPTTGIWHNYFDQTTFNVTNSEMEMELAPGEYMLLSTREFSHPSFTTKVEVERTGLGQFLFYPNPASHHLYWTAKDVTSVEIYNLRGERLLKKNITEPEDGLSLETINPGIYFIKVLQKGNSVVSKFIRE